MKIVEAITNLCDILINNKKLILKHIVISLISVAVLWGIFYCIFPDLHVRIKELRKFVLIVFLLEFTTLLFKEKALYRVIAYFIIGCLVMPLWVYSRVYGQGVEVLSVQTYCFLIASGYLLTICNIFGKKFLPLKLLGTLFTFTYAGILIIFIGYYAVNGTWFGTDALLAIMQTNSGEAMEYLAGHLNVASMAVGFGILILIINYLYFVNKISLKINNYIYIIVCVTLSAFMCYKCSKNLITEVFINAKQNMTSYQKFEEKVLQRKKEIANLQIQHNDDDGIFVLVIGESQNRNNMHAYGYHRENTPWLSEIKKDDNFVLFTNAYSCHTHTVPVLTYALTAKNQYNKLSLEKSISLIEIAEVAGYETAWISNQVRYGAWDTPITVIANEANQQEWYNDNRGETTRTNFYDLKLIEGFDKLNLKKRMLIVVHLMGNHGGYEHRYPKEFGKYGDDNNLNKYDNSILYNDYVVENIFQKVKTLPNFKGLVYFADHADAVNHNLSHDASQYVPEMTHIPMYMYFSEQYMEENGEIVKNLKAAQNKMFTNDLVYNFMLSIMGIYGKSVNENKNDLTNSGYDNNSQRFKTLYGKKNIEP